MLLKMEENPGIRQSSNGQVNSDSSRASNPGALSRTRSPTRAASPRAGAGGARASTPRRKNKSKSKASMKQEEVEFLANMMLANISNSRRKYSRSK
jgi:hypothetical protein